MSSKCKRISSVDLLNALMLSSTTSMYRISIHRSISYSSLNRRIRKIDMVPSQIEMLASAWNREHLYTVGTDILKLKLYEKFSSLAAFEGGGKIKVLVHDFLSFIKKNWSHGSDKEVRSQLNGLIYFGSNYELDASKETIKNNNPENRTGIQDSKSFYIALGYSMMLKSEGYMEEIVDKLVEIYKTRRSINIVERDYIESELLTSRILQEYYRKVPINYDKLYRGNKPFIRLYFSNDHKIFLPPLPEISDRELLARSLMHKETSDAILDPSHKFGAALEELSFKQSKFNTSFMKNDLSVLDGLGDFVLARESSDFLYKYKVFTQDERLVIGRKTYKLLRVIFATNTLLSQLALSYNLHQGLNDVILYKLMRRNYVPSLNKWKNSTLYEESEKIRKYEQEFIGDYFEQYVGALYLESPQIAKEWLYQIFDCILSSIVEVLYKKGDKPIFSTEAISTEVIGRHINRAR